MPTRDGHDCSMEALLLLRAARETGALDALAESAGTPRALASETALTPDGAEVVVAALDDLGFLERVDGEYEFTNRALGFLAKRDVRSVGPIPHGLDVLDALVALPETLTTGEPPERPPNWIRNRAGAEAATNEALVRARVTAARREAPDAGAALMVGLGGGSDARELAARGLDVTAIDSPPVAAAVGPTIAHAGVDTRSESLADHDGRYGLVYAVDLCTRVTPAEARTIVAAAADRLTRTGALVLVETLRDRVDQEVAVGVDVRRFALGAGGAHGSARYREWGDAAGIEVTFADVPGTDGTAVVYRRPERTVQED